MCANGPNFLIHDKAMMMGTERVACAPLVVVASSMTRKRDSARHAKRTSTVSDGESIDGDPLMVRTIKGWSSANDRPSDDVDEATAR